MYLCVKFWSASCFNARYISNAGIKRCIPNTQPTSFKAPRMTHPSPCPLALYMEFSVQTHTWKIFKPKQVEKHQGDSVSNLLSFRYSGFAYSLLFPHPHGTALDYPCVMYTHTHTNNYQIGGGCVAQRIKHTTENTASLECLGWSPGSANISPGR